MPADHELIVGQTRIAYAVVTSSVARRSRIVVDRDGVRVVVPAGADALERAATFVNTKRRWVYQKWRSVPRVPDRDQRFVSGARVLYRGRHLKLIVQPGDVAKAHVDCRARFDVVLPRQTWGSVQKEAAAQAAVEAWLRARLLSDGQELAQRFARSLGVELKGVRVLKMRRLWASCGRDRIVRLNPELAELPSSLFAYVVAHEVAHLVHRNHGARFWRTVATLVGQSRRSRTELDRIARARALE